MGSYQPLQPTNRRCLILVLLIFTASAAILILYCLITPQKNPRPTFDQPQTSTSTATRRKVKQITGCLDNETKRTETGQGEFNAIYNFAMASRRFGCAESITYTTHSDYGFLDNVIPVVEKWRGPVSVAVHAPGYDFDGAVDSIAYLRECTSPMVKELVTFHVYFGVEHVPENVSTGTDFKQIATLLLLSSQELIVQFWVLLNHLCNFYPYCFCDILNRFGVIAI